METLAYILIIKHHTLTNEDNILKKTITAIQYILAPTPMAI